MTYEIYLGSLVLSLSAALGVSYSRRRKWQKLLSQPASELQVLLRSQRRKPRWLKKLVRELDGDLNLDQNASVFEVLYRHFKARERREPPHLLGLALNNTALFQHSPLANELTPKQSVTDEEKLSALMNAQADPSFVPTETFAQNAVLNLLSILKGKKNLKTGLEHAVLDSFAPSGGVAGAKLGGALGLALAPLLAGFAALLIPISAVLGAWLGALAGKQLGGRLKRRRYFSARKRLRRVSQDFQNWFLKQTPALIKEQKKQLELSLHSARQTYLRHQSLWLRMLYPDLMSIFYKDYLKRLKSDHLLEYHRFKQISAQVRTLDPIEFAALMQEVEPKTIQAHPKLLELYREYQLALKDVQKAQEEICA